MKKLLVLAFVAVLCVPSYGEILVYKFTCNLDTGVDFTDDSYSEAAVGIERITGYCVVDVDLDTENFNGNPTLIFYGKEGKTKWGMNFDVNEAGDEIGFTVFDITGTTNEGILVFVDDEDEHERVGAFYVPLYGKIEYIAIGKTNKAKVYIPKTLKGTIEAWAETSDVFEAFGTIIVTLDSKYTQDANKNAKTQQQTADKIIADLEKKGHVFD